MLKVFNQWKIQILNAIHKIQYTKQVRKYSLTYKRLNIDTTIWKLCFKETLCEIDIDKEIEC